MSKQTRQKVAFVGHSQGAGQLFVALSRGQKPQIARKVSCFVALAPAVYLGPSFYKFPLTMLAKVTSRDVWRTLFGGTRFAIAWSVHSLTSMPHSPPLDPVARRDLALVPRCAFRVLCVPDVAVPLRHARQQLGSWLVAQSRAASWSADFLVQAPRQTPKHFRGFATPQGSEHLYHYSANFLHHGEYPDLHPPALLTSAGAQAAYSRTNRENPGSRTTFPRS